MRSYVGALQHHGAVRADLSAQECVEVALAVTYGFVSLPSLLDDAGWAAERVADRLADTVERVLAPARRATLVEAEAADRATREHLDVAVDMARQAFHDALRDSGPASGGAT